MKRKNYEEVLGAIEELVAKKKTTKEKVAADSKDILIKYTKDYFSEVEDLVSNKVATYELLERSFSSYKTKIRSIDPGANIMTFWNKKQDFAIDTWTWELESINSVKIIWSNAYCKSQGIDKEITIDQFDCVLRS